MDGCVEQKQKYNSSFTGGLSDIDVKAMNVYSYSTVVLLMSNEMWEAFEIMPIALLFCVLVTGIHVASTPKSATMVFNFS